MAIEARRGCGYRKVGGIYLVADGNSLPCGRLPIPLTVCPCCGIGIKPTRGWTWVTPELLMKDLPACRAPKEQCGSCLLSDPANLGKKAGLIWIGEQFYPTPQHFVEEAKRQGISRRIKAVPHGFEVGKTWVLLAHRKTIQTDEGMEPGIFRIFCPRAIEVIVTDEQADDDEFMEGLEKRGLTPVVVPAGDPDHDPGAKKKGRGTAKNRIGELSL